jgi:hypothetical protein
MTKDGKLLDLHHFPIVKIGYMNSIKKTIEKIISIDFLSVDYTTRLPPLLAPT